MANILFLAHRIPYPPNKGDKIRSWNFLRRLASEHTVHAGFYVDDPNDRENISVVGDLCASSCAVEVSPFLQKLYSLRGFLCGRSLTEMAYPRMRLRRYVSRLLQSGQVDCVFLFSAATATLIEEDCAVPIISDLVDVDSAKWEAYADAKEGPLSWIYSREGRLLSRFEGQVAGRSHASLFVSEDEAKLMRERHPDVAAKVFGVANGVATEVFDPALYDIKQMQGPEPARVVFTGAMNYAPNIEAVAWFTKEIWGRVIEKFPEAEFVIAGSPVSAEVKKLASAPGVTVLGFVEDMAQVLAEARVVVAPLKTARGIQNKVLEAMAMAKPVVATRLANEGINAPMGEGVLLADEIDSFASQIIDLLNSPEKALEIGACGRAYVLEHFSWDQKYGELADLVKSACDAK